MCGRFSLELDDTFYPRYEVDTLLEISPNYNVAPSSIIPVIVKNSPKKIIKMKWGYLPSWSKEYDSKYSVINTRVETIQSKPYFKESFTKYRCLIPATGFYEWRKDPTEKIPFYIHLKNSKYFSFAGIYSIWKDVSGKEFYTCSIITTKPNKLMIPIHDRMPVILSKEEEEIWIDKQTDLNVLKSLLDQYPSNEMEAYQISKDVNSPKNNYRKLLSRYT